MKFVLPAAVALSVALPMQVAYAQAPAPAAAASDKTDTLLVIRPAHILAIGAGVVGGVIVGEALFASDLGVVVTGVLGGYLANVWYSGRQLELHIGGAPKS